MAPIVAHAVDATTDDAGIDGQVSPLAKKLRLTPGARAAVVNAPDGYIDNLGPPVGTALDGPLDWIHVYPKGSSKRQTDLTRDRGWEPLEGSDLMWLSLVSVDDTWSAFGLRPYKPGEARQTFR
jgi:hypothetical protein